MFIYKLSSWLDHYDPYWYGRLIALKAAYLAVGLFIANLVLQPPMATLVMLVSAVGVLIAEMPPINDLNKKDMLYLAYVIVMCITIALFASTVYLKGWFILTASAWTYLLYFVLRKKPEVYAIVSGVLMIGIISLEGYNSGNFFDILNTIIFILEFSLISFGLHKLFPFFYSKIWLSSLLRCIEVQLQMLEQFSSNQSMHLFEHYLVAESSLNLLANKSYYAEAILINQSLSHFHYYLLRLIELDDLSSIEYKLISEDLAKFKFSILNSCSVTNSSLASSDHHLIKCHHHLYAQFKQSWNNICVHVSN